VNSTSEGQLRDGRSRNVINVALEEGREVEKGEGGREPKNGLTKKAKLSGGNKLELDTVATIDAADPDPASL
jgi:hypothetical protein